MQNGVVESSNHRLWVDKRLDARLFRGSKH